MRTLVVLTLLGLTTPALADYYPYVGKGPVITGVTDSEAWVAWYTLHHQGKGGVNECSIEALTGTPNTKIPTLTLTPASATAGTFVDQACDVFHKVHLTGLSPATDYTFTLDMPYADKSAAAGRFRTAPKAGSAAKFSFIVFGDNRDNAIGSTQTRPQHQALIDGMVARDDGVSFVVNVGDYALNLPLVSGDDRGYTEFFEVERKLLAGHALVPAVGNHETIDMKFFDGLMSAPTFAGLPHPYYYGYDWGQAHIAVLFDFEGPANILSGGAHDAALSDAQAQWLDGDLKAAQQAGKLIFVVVHQGAYSHGDSKSHGGLKDVQQKVVPLMVKYGALAMFAGHDHYYERGHEGCIDYAVVGAGGAEMYMPDATAAGVLAAKMTPSYMVVTVDGNSASAVVRDSSGATIDQLTFKPATCAVAPPDAGAPPDGGVAEDAAAPPDGATEEPDASEEQDLRQPPDKRVARDLTEEEPDLAEEETDAGEGAEPDGGCGCRVGGRHDGSAATLAVLLLLACALRRRRA